MLSRFTVLAQISLLLLFVYMQYYGIRFGGSDAERGPVGSSHSALHK